MFKKSNRNFRTRKTEFNSSEDDEKGEIVVAEAKQVEICVETKNDKLVQATVIKQHQSAKVLSFNDAFDNDDDDDSQNGTSEFKVKKSKESRRIARELKKSRKEKERNVTNEPSQISSSNIRANTSVEDVLYNEGIKIRPLKVIKEEIKTTTTEQHKKYLINKYKSNEDDDVINSDDEFKNYAENMIKSDEEYVEDEDEEEESRQLRKLREEMEVLTGEDMIPVENEKDETKRSMKLMLKSGIIPDANLIHAARKKREMARQGDYIPIGPDKGSLKSTSKKNGAEDDDDEDHEFSDEERISMNYREKVHQERVETRNNFLSVEQGSDEEEENNNHTNDLNSDNEEDKWEQEQIRKGVQISQTISQKFGSQLNFKDTRKEKIIGKILHEKYFENEDVMEIEAQKSAIDMEKLKNMPQITFLSIKDSLTKNLESLKQTYRAHENEHEMTLQNLNANKTDYENMKKQKPQLEKQYIYFQDMKAYVRDFIDCYNEKIADIEKAETNLNALLKQKSDKIINRRHQDLRDQNLEATNAISTSSKKTIDAEHQKRMTDRESRREKRKKARQEVNYNYLNEIEKDACGLSSDDEEMLAEHNLFKKQKDEVVNQLNDTILADVAEDFFNYDLIKQRFEQWKLLNSQTYRNSYVLLSLPKLFSPLVRIELLDWNPLDNHRQTNAENFIENSKWYTHLLSYNKNDIETKDDNDFMLIPYIIEKNVLNKLIQLIENVYDPLSTSQTLRLSNLIKNLINDYPTLNGQSENTKKLIECSINKIKKCIDNDIFVPLYSRQIIEQKENEASVYFHRQFWTSVKLFKNITKWHCIFSDQIVKELSLDCILNRYLMIALQSMEPNMNTIKKIEYITNHIPKEWLNINNESTKSMSLPQLKNLISLIRRIADSINENEFKKNKIESDVFKENIKHIRKLFISLGATDQAITLSNLYELN